MKLGVLLIPLVIFISACDPVSERECDVFDHPGLGQWQQDSANTGNVQFMSDAGVTIDFERETVVINEPFLGSDSASNDSDVTCLLTANVRLRSDNERLAINAIYTQLEQSQLDSDEETLLIDLRLENPLGTELVGGYTADISIDIDRTILNISQVEYLESPEDQEEIGGVSYTDVVRITGADLSPGADDPRGEAINLLTQIIIAREFGVVAFTDTDDVQFVRVAN